LRDAFLRAVALRHGQATLDAVDALATLRARLAIAHPPATWPGLLADALSDFVTPDDVKRCALPALRHRVLLAPDAQLEGRRVDELIVDLLATVEAPRL